MNLEMIFSTKWLQMAMVLGFSRRGNLASQIWPMPRVQEMGSLIIHSKANRKNISTHNFRVPGEAVIKRFVAAGVVGGMGRIARAPQVIEVS